MVSLNKLQKKKSIHMNSLKLKQKTNKQRIYKAAVIVPKFRLSLLLIVT